MSSTLFEFKQVWSAKAILPEKSLEVLEGLIKDGLVLLKSATPSTDQLSEVTIRGKTIKLCPAEKRIVPLVAKAFRLDLLHVHAMFKSFVVAWDADPTWRDTLTKPQASLPRGFGQEVANKFVVFVRQEKKSLLALLTLITLAKDDNRHPLQETSRLLFAKFCSPALGEDVLAALLGLPAQEANQACDILSFLTSLVGANVPFSAQSKVRFAKWYFDHSHVACVLAGLDSPGTRALMDALFVGFLELDSLDYHCDLAPDMPHWTLASPDATCELLALVLKTRTSEKNKLVFKALALLATSLLQTFQEASPDQAEDLCAFLKNPSSIVPDQAHRTSCFSVPELLNRRLGDFSWANVLTQIQSSPCDHAIRALAPVLVAAAVLEPSAVMSNITSYLACVGAVYQQDAILCSKLWGCPPGSSQRFFLEFVQSGYPAIPSQLPLLLKNLSFNCVPQVIQYLGALSSLTIPVVGDMLDSVTSVKGSAGDVLVEAPRALPIKLPVFRDQMVEMLTIPVGTRGSHVASLAAAGSLCWRYTYNGWDVFFKVFEALASKPVDRQALYFLHPVLELFVELAVAQPRLFEAAFGRGEDFTNMLIAIVQPEQPESGEFKASVFHLLAALLPLHPRAITAAFNGWFTSPSFASWIASPSFASAKGTFIRIFTLCSSYCVQQTMLGAFGFNDLARLGNASLHYALVGFRTFFGASDLEQLLKSRLSLDATQPPVNNVGDLSLEILSNFVRLAQSPAAPRWLTDRFAQELSDRKNNYKYAHLFLRAINLPGSHLQLAVELMANLLLLKLSSAKDTRFGHLILVRALLEHSNPQSPWILVSLFKMIRPGADTRLAYSAAKALGLLLAAAESANLSCLAGHIPDSHALYGAGIVRLLRAPSTPRPLQKRLWYLLTVLATFQQELMAQLFPDAAVLADLVLVHLADWDGHACKAPIACFLAAAWKSRWCASVVMPLLSTKVWELVDRHIRKESSDPEDFAASAHLLELVCHHLIQSTRGGWDSSFFKAVKALTDSQAVSPVFLRGLLPSPKPQGLDQLINQFANPSAYVLPLQGTLLGDLCSNDSGMVYDLSATISDLPPQLAKHMAAADQCFYKDQTIGKLLMAWQRTVVLVFKQPVSHWLIRGDSCAKTSAELIQGIIKSIEPVARQKQRISSPGSLGLGCLLGSLLSHAVRYSQPGLAAFISENLEILKLCMRWSFRQRIACRQHHKTVLAQAGAWYQVVGRSMQLLAQEHVPCDLGVIHALIEDELLLLLGGDFIEDKEKMHESLSILLESLLIILNMPRPPLWLKEKTAAIRLSEFLLGQKLSPILAYQIVLVLLRSASLGINFIQALPKESLLEDFPRLYPLPPWSLESTHPSDGLVYYAHAAFLRLVNLFKGYPPLPTYLSTLADFVCSTIGSADIAPSQMCLLKSATIRLTTTDGLSLYNNVLDALPRLLARLLTDTWVFDVASSSRLMQLAQEHVAEECANPMKQWEGELIFCILGHLQRIDHSGDLSLALTLEIREEVSFGSLVEIVKKYSHSNHPSAALILRASLDLLTSQLLLLVSGNRLEPLSRRHISYDIQQELKSHQPALMSPELSSSWACFTSLLSSPNFFAPV